MTHLNLVRGTANPRPESDKGRKRRVSRGDFVLLKIDIMMIDNRRLKYLKREFTV